MGEVVNLQKIKEQKEYDYTTYNHNYFEMLHKRIEREVNSIAKYNNPDNTNMVKLIAEMTNDFVDSVEELVFGNRTTAGDVKGDLLLGSIMRNVNTLLNGGIISPITGDSDEWLDITKDEDKGKPFKVEYFGKIYEITVDKMEVNLRYSRIYRFNGDNNLAHRIDYIQFRDVKNFANVYLNGDSIRFIQFPYRMDEVHVPVVIGKSVENPTGTDNEANQIIDYINYDTKEITDGIIYANDNPENGSEYLIAPKIPYNLLEEYGINIDEEIKKFLDKKNN